MGIPTPTVEFRTSRTVLRIPCAQNGTAEVADLAEANLDARLHVTRVKEPDS
jgi:hypothetical protein